MIPKMQAVSSDVIQPTQYMNNYQSLPTSPLDIGGQQMPIDMAGLGNLSGLGNIGAGIGAGAGSATGGPGMLGSLFGHTNAQGGWNPGMAGNIMGTVQGLANVYMGMKQYGLAKDTLAENKKQFALNFGAQQKMTNSRLEDRQAARVASNPSAYQSVGEYMKQNGI